MLLVLPAVDDEDDDDNHAGDGDDDDDEDGKLQEEQEEEEEEEEEELEVAEDAVDVAVVAAAVAVFLTFAPVDMLVLLMSRMPSPSHRLCWDKSQHAQATKLFAVTHTKMGPATTQHASQEALLQSRLP